MTKKDLYDFYNNPGEWLTENMPFFKSMQDYCNKNPGRCLNFKFVTTVDWRKAVENYLLVIELVTEPLVFFSMAAILGGLALGMCEGGGTAGTIATGIGGVIVCVVSFSILGGAAVVAAYSGIVFTITNIEEFRTHYMRRDLEILFP
jgi:hypothetical protein